MTTYAGDCVTPQSVFNLGDTVCVEGGNFPIPPNFFRYRRFQWVAPNGAVTEQSSIKVDPQNDKFVIPTSGDFARPGTWLVQTVGIDASINSAAKFTVRHPRLRLTDLAVLKSGPMEFLPGATVQYRLTITNPGPDFAEGIELIDEVPSNMVFMALKQASGPFVECKTPLRGSTGRIFCQTKGLEVNASLVLVAYYTVDREARDGTECLSTSQVSSFTEELGKEDNFFDLKTVVNIPKEDEETVIVDDPE